MARFDDRVIENPHGGIKRLLEIMARLRDPEKGCPWDIEQDFASIAPYTIEEAYEVADAIAREAWDELEGELGDLLLQVVYFAEMGREENRFDFDSIANRIGDKMVLRHPHIFADQSRDKTVEQQSRDWEEIKAAERGGQHEGGALGGVARALPALLRAQKIQKRAARVGFDWDEITPALEKVREEIDELIEAREQGQGQGRVEAEMGDLFFALVNVARHLRVDAENALKAASERFSARFRELEARVSAAGRTLGECTLQELDELWEQAKVEQAKAENDKV